MKKHTYKATVEIEISEDVMELDIEERKNKEALNKTLVDLIKDAISEDDVFSEVVVTYSELVIE